MLLDVELKFNNRIKEIFITRTDLMNFFLNHPRKKLCINNLCSEIVTAEKKLGSKMNGKAYENMIGTVAELFCENALKAAEYSLKTDASKRLITKENDELDDLANSIEYENKEAESSKFKRFMS